jgi:hypothetical protein
VRGTAFSLLIVGFGLSVDDGPRAAPMLPAHAAEAPRATAEPLMLESPPARVSPATRYASLSTDACLAELDARHVDYTRVERAGIETPVRIGGRLSGVRIHTLLPEKERARSPYEIFDCRLVLAFDDFAKILLRHDIVDVMHYSAFRPLVPGVVKRGHESALAIDVAFLGRADGTAYNILRDFTPMKGEHPCTPLIRAAGPRELRAIVCEAVEQGLFHVALTPDYDAPHRDHFHLEIMPGAATSYAR